MTKVAIFIYGIFAYIFAFVGQLVFTLYVGGFSVFGHNINDSATMSLSNALLINLALTIFFGIQHSVMARSWLKRVLLKFMPEAMERSTYVFFSGFALFVVTLFWQAINGTLWEFKNGFAYYFLYALFWFGWAFSLGATFIINHFELFGLQQVYNNLKGRQAKEIEFQEKLLYKFMRHPIQVGVIIGLWATPIMSYTHLILALIFTIYIFIGLYFEEKDLVKELGEVYKKYKQRVGIMFPKKN